MGKNIKTRRRKILIAVIAPLFLLGLFLWLFLPVNSGAENSQNCTYYISPSGNDNNSGRDISHPWKTIAKVNNVTFKPGDVICFKSGGTWRGVFKPKGSGQVNKWIKFSSYGPGPKPEILGSERVSGWEHYSGLIYRKTNMNWAEHANYWAHGIAGVFEYDNKKPIRFKKKSSLPTSNKEWYYSPNKDDGTLYIITSDGKSPDTHDIEVPKIYVILTVSNLSYVEFSNFSMKFAGWDTVDVGEDKSGDSDHIIISDCDISYSGTPRHVAIFVFGGEFVEIKDCRIFDAGDGVLFYPSKNRSGHHGVVRGCIVGGDTNGPGDGICVHESGREHQSGNYFLFENNILSGAKEGGIDVTSGNHHIIRNNIAFNNTDGLELGNQAHHCIIENNIFYNNNGDGLIATSYPPPRIRLGIGGGHIVRNNVIYDNLSYGIIVNHENNKIYNNLVSNCKTRNDVVIGYECHSDNSSFKNNIMFNNIGGGNRRLDFHTGSPSKVELDYNTYYHPNSKVFYIYETNKLLTLEQMRDIYNRANNSFIANPIFQDLVNKDFHLQKSSPCIDTGAFLTKTVSSGSGTQIPLKDASYFTDGFGIVKGDLIQLEGQTQTARITKVDYNNNIITIDKPLSWHKGQGVSLPYSGSAPDIGAYEYQGESSSPQKTSTDINQDSRTDIQDLGIFLSHWGRIDKGRYDINQDGKTDSNDADILLSTI